MRFLLLIAAFFLLLRLPAARADGCYVPEKAFQKMPEITAQRALLKWKDGEETLIIASALDSESQRLAWIVPLPAEPSVIEKADPGGLKTLNFCIQPKISDGIPPGVPILAILTSLALLLFAIVLFSPRWTAWAFVLLGIPLLLLALAFQPSGLFLGGKPVHLVSPLPTEKTAATGVYDTSILRPKTFADLNAWLDHNSFRALPASAEPAVADYLQRHWVFAAVRLAREEKGANTPAPIKLVFPTPEAVYPLGLTAMDEKKPLPVELVILGDQRAEIPSFSTEFCSRYQKNEVKAPFLGSGNMHQPESFTYFYATAGENGGYQKFGHPALLGLFWEDCVLTKLSGNLPSARTGTDLHVQWADFTPRRPTLYTPSGALGRALNRFTLLFAAFVGVSLLLCEDRIRQRHGFFRYVGKRLLPGALGCALLAGAYFLRLPKARGTLVTAPYHDPPKFIMAQRGAFERHYEDSFWLAFAKIDEYHIFPDTDRMTEAEIGQKIREMFRDPEGSFQHHLKWEREHGYPTPPNRLYGGEILCESTPGNFTVAKRDGKVIVTLYDSIGLPTMLEYSASW